MLNNFLAGSNLLWTIILVAVCVLAAIIVTVIIVNSIINSKCNKLAAKEKEEKETALKKRLGLLEDDNQEETTTEEPVEDTPIEEKSNVEEIKEEPTEETPIEEEVKEEPVEDTPVEEEVKEEPIEEAPVEEEVKEEAVAETQPEDDKDYSDEAANLLKDVPDAKDNVVEEKEEAPVEEEVKEETPAEEVKQEAPAKKPAKKSATKKEAKPETPKAPLPRKAPAKKATPTDKPMADGKWILTADADGYYYGELKANNGQLILTTEKYKGVNGIKSGIDTIKKNLDKNNYEISVDKNNTANFKLFGSNAALLCIGEGYTTKENAESAINSVKNFVNSPIIVSEEIDETVNKKYEIASAEKNNNGRWIIVDTKDGYLHGELKANNGQVLLVTENYKGVNSLNSGLETLKKNISAGNFGVNRDKNDHYNFKIFSENKRLVALGAGYSSLTSCESAIISVMKFSDAPIIDNTNED